MDLKTAVTSLGDSAAVLENLWRNWYSACPISPVFYGKGVGSDASGRAIELSLIGTTREVERRRNPYEAATRWAVQVTNLMRRLYGAGALEYAVARDLVLQYEPVVPESPDSKLARVAQGVQAGFLSRRQALRELYPDWTEAQVERAYQEARQEQDEEQLLAQPLGSLPGF